MNRTIYEEYRGYRLTARPGRTRRGRWSVAVEIGSSPGAETSRTYYAEDGISYILEEEAAKECLNLGRNLIDGNRL